MMNLFKYCLLIILMSCTSGNNYRASVDKNANCDDSKISESLLVLAESYNPLELNLIESIKKNESINIFLDTTEVECLTKNNKFDFFVLEILLRQYYFHLSEFHQGFDLMQMRSDQAKILIDRFIVLTKLDSKSLEMLNSGYVITFIKDKPILYAEHFAIIKKIQDIR
jgi:hypothetical protein